MPLIHEQTGEAIEINPQSIERLLDFCERRNYPKKSIIVKEGDPADTVYYIVKGSVSIISHDDDGNEVVLAYLNPGDFIGEIGIFFRTQSRLALVRARTACQMAEIKYDKLHQLFTNELKNEQTDIFYAIGFQLSQRLLKTSRKVTRLAYMDVAGRIARTLLDLCNEPEAMSHPDGTQIHISRQELGRIVGCSREVVGRILKRMADDGMIEVKGMDIVVYHSR